MFFGGEELGNTVRVGLVIPKNSTVKKFPNRGALAHLVL